MMVNAGREASAQRGARGRGQSKASIIAVVVIVACVLAGVAAWMLLGAGGQGARAVVHDGDGGTTNIELSGADETFTITTSLGTNVVRLEGGEVFVEEADCANHDCMKQGKISTPGQQIVCLPHKLWIEVVAADGQASSSSAEDVAQGFDTVAR